MILRGCFAGVLWLSLIHGWCRAAPTVEERAEAEDGKEPPRVGLTALQACTSSTQDEACTRNMELVTRLEADKYISVTGFEKGVLNCESLRHAEDAPVLRVNLTNFEEVTAKRKSFKASSGGAFSDDVNRMVWRGEVIESGEPFGGIPRSITMSWSDCDVEHFMLRVKTPKHDGRTRVMATLPCMDPSEPKKVCLLQLDHAAEEEGLEIMVVDGEELLHPPPHQDPYYRKGDGEAEGGPSFYPCYMDRNQNQDADGNDRNRRRRRHLRQNANSDGEGTGDDSGSTTGTDVSMGTSESQQWGARPGRKTSEAHRRRLANEVSEGMERKRASDPDVDAKDKDVRLLNEYLLASSPEQDVFHERGFRRLSSAEVQMPSGRVLSATNDIDIMVLYTAASMVSAGYGSTLLTPTQMETKIIAAYAVADDAFADSGISATLNVVHVAQVDFVESTEMNEDLADIAKGQGMAAGFDALRTTYGADLVQMIGFYEGSCGTGYVMASPGAAFENFAYSIVHVNCLDDFSHIHEIGHNMGANHNREDSVSFHEYAHAQRYCTGAAPFFRTIMSYETGCLEAPRVAMFSTQGKKYAGKSLGSATTDNARIIRESLATVVNFKDSIMA